MPEVSRLEGLAGLATGERPAGAAQAGRLSYSVCAGRIDGSCAGHHLFARALRER